MGMKIKLFITFFLLYVYFIHWVGWSENSHFNLIRAIVDEDRLEVDSYYNNTSDRAYYNGHYYSDKAPGITFLVSPIYLAFKVAYYELTPSVIVDYLESRTQSSEYEVRYVGSGYVGGGVPIYTRVSPGFFILTSMMLITVFTSPLFTALTVVLVYCTVKYFTEKESHRLGVTLAYSLATLAFPNALVLVSSPAGTFFVFLAFYLILKAKQENSTKHLFVSGFALGFAVVCEYPILIISLMVLVYALYATNLKRVVSIILPAFIVGLSPLLLYNYIIFDTPSNLTLQYNDPEIWGMATDRELRYYGFIPSLNLPVLLHLTLFPYRGLFFYHPLLLLSIVGLFYMYNKNKSETALILLILTSFIILYSSRRIWHGGAIFGIRYMLPTIPFLMIPLAYALKKINLKVVSILALTSILVNIIGIQQPEDIIINTETLYISDTYKEKQKNFGMLCNPIVDYYLPLFLRHGPRSRIFEQASSLIVNIDIRDYIQQPKGFRSPFLTIIPPIIMASIIWFREIRLLIRGPKVKLIDVKNH